MSVWPGSFGIVVCFPLASLICAAPSCPAETVTFWPWDIEERVKSKRIGSLYIT
jgi:hypothetical protein